MHVRQKLAAAIVCAAMIAAGCASTPTESAAPAPSASPAPAVDAVSVIQQRQAAMRQIGGAMRSLGGLAAATPPDPAAIRTAAQPVAQAAAQLRTLFPAGTGPDSAAPTRALPAIWNDPAAFAQQLEALNTAAQAAANAQTPEAAATAVRGIGATCASCHAQFRAP